MNEAQKDYIGNSWPKNLGKNMQRIQKNMTKEEWIQFIVISAIYAVFNITKELIKERKSKKWKQNLRTEILTRATVEAQHNYEVLLDERNYFQDMVLSMYKELEEAKKELKE